ncbi:MAG: hypothetical protein ACE5I4_00285 [Thermoplasmata archaeon]
MTERIYERYAWMLLAAVSVLFLPIAIGDVILGAGGDQVTTQSVAGVSWTELQETDPGVAALIDIYARLVGVGLLGLSLLSLAVAVTAYRRWERWAWYGLWTWPLVLVLIIALYGTAMMPGSTLPPPLFSAPILLALAVLGLLLPVRGFLLPEGRPDVSPVE